MNKKYIFAGLAVIIIIIAIISFRGSNDSYVCKDGAWVAVGSPTTPPPTTGCGSSEEKAVTLYYYNPAKDTDASGNILCSSKGLVAVQRKIPASSDDQIAETVKLLLSGEISVSERAAGVTTEFPLEGVTLTDIQNDDGDITLTFSDPNAKTGGGSCRVGILWAQISETAKQFPGVKSVRFMPEELFQP